MKTLQLEGVNTDEVIGVVTSRFLGMRRTGSEGATLDKFVWEHSKGEFESLRALREILFEDEVAGQNPEEIHLEIAEWACRLISHITYRLVTSSWYKGELPASKIAGLLIGQKGWGSRLKTLKKNGLPPRVKHVGKLLYQELERGVVPDEDDRALCRIDDLEESLKDGPSVLNALAKTAFVAVKLQSGLTLVDAGEDAVAVWKHADEISRPLTCYFGFPRPLVVRKQGSGIFPLNLDPEDEWVPEV